jgi:hypothetical protein
VSRDPVRYGRCFATKSREGPKKPTYLRARTE